ncbi:Receptor-Type Tyrosine-Protein Phosphatase N2 [Manis pentadactyla]|nr:Receptor-Type Tyrosine-Protein Phosphatase N2 [Manis pentadactyla]
MVSWGSQGITPVYRCQSSDHPSVATLQGAACGQPPLPGVHGEGGIKPQPILVPAGRRRGPAAALLLCRRWPAKEGAEKQMVIKELQETE